MSKTVVLGELQNIFKLVQACFDRKAMLRLYLGAAGDLNKEIIKAIKKHDDECDKKKEPEKKYNITLVPTIILSSNAKDYSSLNQAWSQVGSIETDGTFVFRDLSLLNIPYKDLYSNKIINNTNSTQ